MGESKGSLQQDYCVQIDAMRRSNLGKPCTQETKDRISRARKAREWEYLKVPPENPLIGCKAMVNKKSCIWAACPVCGKQRWVRAKRGGVPSNDICNVCVNRLPEKCEAAKARETGRQHSPSRVVLNKKLRIAEAQVHKEKKKIERVRSIRAKRWTDYSIVSHDEYTEKRIHNADIGVAGDIAFVRAGHKGRKFDSLVMVKVLCARCHNETFWTRMIHGEPRHILCRSCTGREMRENHPEVFRRARIKWQASMKRSIHMKPNKTEQALQIILNRLYPSTWAFVGDWSMVLAGKNPDFVNINGRKQIIELFGDYWHKGEKAGDRIALFARFGYNTLVVWEKELKDMERLERKIKSFVDGHTGIQ